MFQITLFEMALKLFLWLYTFMITVNRMLQSSVGYNLVLVNCSCLFTRACC